MNQEIIKPKRETRKYVTVALAVLILVISVGYAVLQTNLNINGTITTKANTWNIHFANQTLTSESIGVVPSVVNNSTTVEFTAPLTLPGNTYEFTLDIVNAGSIDAKISSISLPTITQSYILFNMEYLNGAPVSVGDLLKSDNTKTIKVTVKYRTDIDDSELPTSNEEISGNVTIVYSQDDGTGTEPTTAPTTYTKTATARSVAGSEYDGTWTATYKCENGTATIQSCSYSGPYGNATCDGGNFHRNPTYMCTTSTDPNGGLMGSCNSSLYYGANGAGLPESEAC